MRRRDFLAVAGTGLAWSLSARAQTTAVPLVAVYNINPITLQGANQGGLVAGLAESGLVLGRDYSADVFSAGGQADRLPDLMAAALRRNPAVIVASGGILPVQVAQNATATIPIVFTSGVDPASTGVVRTMNRPGGNITGVYIIGRELDAKRLEVLHDLVPTASTIGIVFNPRGTPPDLRGINKAADQLGLQLVIAEALSDANFDGVVRGFLAKGVQAILVCSDPVLSNSAVYPDLVERAINARLPQMYEFGSIAAAGAFAGYGANIVDAYRLAGTLVAQILRGAMPAELPVLQPTKFELVINNRTAKSIGVTVPPTVLFRADLVIE